MEHVSLLSQLFLLLKKPLIRVFRSSLTDCHELRIVTVHHDVVKIMLCQTRVSHVHQLI